MTRGIKVVKRTIAGEDVYIKTMSGGAASAQVIELMQQAAGKPSVMLDIGALLITSCLCDENGTLLCTDLEDARNNSSVSYLVEFGQAALQVSGLKDDAEELVKNSEPVQ